MIRIEFPFGSPSLGLWSDCIYLTELISHTALVRVRLGLASIGEWKLDICFHPMRSEIDLALLCGRRK